MSNVHNNVSNVYTTIYKLWSNRVFWEGFVTAKSQLVTERENRGTEIASGKCKAITMVRIVQLAPLWTSSTARPVHLQRWSLVRVVCNSKSAMLRATRKLAATQVPTAASMGAALPPQRLNLLDKYQDMLEARNGFREVNSAKQECFPKFSSNEMVDHHDEHGDLEDNDVHHVVYKGPYRGHEMPGSHKAAHYPYRPGFVIGVLGTTVGLGLAIGWGGIYYQQVRGGYWGSG
eukprot:g82628.t1